MEKHAQVNDKISWVPFGAKPAYRRKSGRVVEVGEDKNDLERTYLVQMRGPKAIKEKVFHDLNDIKIL